jgi:hypothetical protein
LIAVINHIYCPDKVAKQTTVMFANAASNYAWQVSACYVRLGTAGPMQRDVDQSSWGAEFPRLLLHTRQLPQVELDQTGSTAE